ncbi:MAG: tRNA uridine-5-carboxymethylaminomethyl(34) synthesis GTPase MnmE [Paludibacteraceae bacterium]|nr:tRNA uridine-5-carboxymethylaminomethyl(34) synthesis GTPase MnmE [Paludibacteraceae bacterium]
MDTICAISTAYGSGGIAVIRISGPQAIETAERLTGTTLRRQVNYRRVNDLDDMVLTVFRAPHSFTGEDTVEISVHGSLYIQQEVIRRLTTLGCRCAQAGEFTKRSFLNGKMDLAQAEAVADLIAAETQAEKDLALAQLRGSVSSELQSLRDRLLHLTSLLELELDFADHEELEFADRSELKQLADEIENKLSQLIDSFQSGNAIKNGIPVAIIGPTNAGKSTLLNALLGEERAIVSNIAGTTRDTVEDRLIIDGILFRLIDTAGLRETNDSIEQLGIQRSHEAIRQARIIIQVAESEDELLPLAETQSKTVIRVLNKCDLHPHIPVHGRDICCISARNNDLNDLKSRLTEHVRSNTHNGVMISNARHYDALNRALDAIRRVKTGLQNGLSGELTSMDLQDCLNALGEITGQITNTEVLSNIFSKFCIGK